MKRLSADDPRWIGQYRLLSRLGEGGMGRVYLARSQRGRTVAVKVVRAELAQQPDFRRRFALEITAARRVGAGSGQGGAAEDWTAPVLDADTEAGTPWVATGYIAGPSLAEVVDEQYGPLPEHSVSALASGLVKALRAIHGAGLVHRDLKPSNVLITIDGPRVIDFGIARALDAAVQSAGGLTRTGALVGSPGFMSPEQVRGHQVSAASDVFCLGAVLAYAATGRMPFGTDDSGVHALLFRIAEEEPELSGMDGPLRELVAHCLAKDPARRPDLEELLARTKGELSGTWLPGEVLAQLGRHAVQLLDSEDPEGEAEVLGAAGAHAGAAVAAGPAAPSRPSPPSTPPPSSAASSTPPPSFGPPTGAYGPPTAAYAPPGSGPQPWQSVPPQATFPAGNGFPGAGHGTPPPAGRPPRPARSARKLSQTLVVLLSLALLIDLVRLIVHFMVDSALGNAPGDYLGLVDVDRINGYSGLAGATIALEVLSLPLGACLVVVWSMWFWRVRLNAEAFAPGRIRYAAEMAVGAWFLPVCNLFMPKQVLNDVWSASNPAVAPWFGYGPRPAGRRGLVNAWWTLWLCYFCVGFVGSWENWYNAPDVDDAQGTVALALFTDFFSVPATVLALLLVIRLTSLQDGRIAGRG